MDTNQGTLLIPWCNFLFDLFTVDAVPQQVVKADGTDGTFSVGHGFDPTTAGSRGVMFKPKEGIAPAKVNDGRMLLFLFTLLGKVNNVKTCFKKDAAGTAPGVDSINRTVSFTVSDYIRLTGQRRDDAIRAIERTFEVLRSNIVFFFKDSTAKRPSGFLLADANNEPEKIQRTRREGTLYRFTFSKQVIRFLIESSVSYLHIPANVFKLSTKGNGQALRLAMMLLDDANRRRGDDLRGAGKRNCGSLAESLPLEQLPGKGKMHGRHKLQIKARPVIRAVRALNEARIFAEVRFVDSTTKEISETELMASWDTFRMSCIKFRKVAP